MIRAAMGDRRFWGIRVKNRWDSIEMAEEQIKNPADAPKYHAEYVRILLRPNGPSTHVNRYGWRAWLRKQLTGNED
jgi:hypothetical protein